MDRPANRWGDQNKSIGRDGKLKDFDHPFVQATGMFLGETFCLVALVIALSYYRRYKNLSSEEVPSMIRSEKYNRQVQCASLHDLLFQIGLMKK